MEVKGQPNNEKKSKGSFSKKSLMIIGGVFYIILIAIAFIFDSKIALAMSGMRSSFLDFIIIGVSFIAPYAIVIVPSIFLFFSERKVLLKYWFSFAMTFFVMILIKMIVHRQRPFLAMDFTIPASLISASYSAWDFSLPSNHAALSSSALPFLNGKYFWIWLALCALFIFSRIYFGLHYVSDVLIGIAVGVLISSAVKKWL